MLATMQNRLKMHASHLTGRAWRGREDPMRWADPAPESCATPGPAPAADGADDSPNPEVDPYPDADPLPVPRPRAASTMLRDIDDNENLRCFAQTSIFSDFTEEI